MKPNIGEQYKSLLRSGSGLRPFLPGSTGTVILDGRAGVVTVRAFADRVTWLWKHHEAGRTRFGRSPVRTNGTCRWGAIDLDAHQTAAPDRFNDALAVVAGIEKIGLTPYVERSRGGRGYHVWVLFDEPGVPAEQLHLLLSTLAREVVPSDVFPSGAIGHGKMIFFPGFGGDPLLDADLHPVDCARIELDDPTLVTKAIGRPSRAVAVWPPRYFRQPAGSAGGAYSSGTAATNQPGVFVGPLGFQNAKAGARNSIAGKVARRLVCSGQAFDRFQEWDSYNEPPLASDEPKALCRWWASAQKKEAKRGRA